MSDASMTAWIDDLGAAVDAIGKQAEQVVSRGAANIKDDWRQRWRGYPHLPHLPRAITYDLHTDADGSHATVGPDKALEQGGLGHYIEYGVPGQNAPIPGGLPAAAAEEPRFADAAAALGVKLLAGD